jgi:LEA14-like dessication related protein
MALTKKYLTMQPIRTCANFLLLVLPLLAGCAAVQQLGQSQKPSLSMHDTRISGLSFDGLDLVFDVQVDNPNPLGLNLAGFDYDFQINGASFLQGEEARSVAIAANGKSVVGIPLKLNFNELYSSFAGLKNQDSTAYKMAIGLAFDIPVLGPIRVPLEVQGHVPALKIPTLDVGGLKIKKLNFTGADLALELKIKNPNGFDLGLDRLDYQLGIGGQTWAEGTAEEEMEIKSKGTQTIRIPLSVDFTKMGLGLFKTLSGKKPLNYQLKGGLDLSTSLPLLPKTSLPFDRAGTLDILR